MAWSFVEARASYEKKKKSHRKHKPNQGVMVERDPSHTHKGKKRFPPSLTCPPAGLSGSGCLPAGRARREVAPAPTPPPCPRPPSPLVSLLVFGLGLPLIHPFL